MIAIHIEDRPDEVVVTQLDTVIARCPKVGGDIADLLYEVLATLGHYVEVHRD